MYETRKLSTEELTNLWGRLEAENAISYADADFLQYFQDFVMHDGPLSIDGDFELGKGQVLIVDGDLFVGGIYSDCSGTGHLVVLGDMTARAVLTTGTSVVTGRLKAHEVVYCDYNDHISLFSGGVETPALFIFDKQTEFPEAKSAIGMVGWWKEELDDTVFLRLQPEIVAESFDEEPFPDLDSVAKLLSTGKSIFRETPPEDTELFLDAWYGLIEASDYFLDYAANYLEDDEPRLTSEDLAEFIEADVAIRMIIARLPGLEDDLRAKLIEYGEPAVLEVLDTNPATTRETSAKATKASLDKTKDKSSTSIASSSAGRKFGYKNRPLTQAEHASKERVLALRAKKEARHSNPMVRASLSLGGGVHCLDADTLAALAKDTDVKVLCNLVKSGAPIASGDFEALAYHADHRIRTAVAKKLQAHALWAEVPYLPRELVQALASKLVSDETPGLAQTVAPALPAKDQLELGLKWLAEDGDLSDRAMLLACNTTSSELMLELARKESGASGLIRNAAISAAAQHRIIDQIEAALTASDRLAPEWQSIVKGLLGNSGVSDEVIMRVANLALQFLPKDDGLTLAVTNCYDPPNEVLSMFADRELGKHQDNFVRMVPYCPRSPRHLVAWALPTEFRRKRKMLKEHRSFDDLPDDEYWAAMANSQFAILREIAARNNTVPVSALEALSKDDDENIRIATCQNMSFPIDHPKVFEVFENTDSFAHHPRLSDNEIYGLVAHHRKRMGLEIDKNRHKVNALLNFVSQRKLGALFP